MIFQRCQSAFSLRMLATSRSSGPAVPGFFMLYGQSLHRTLAHFLITGGNVWTCHSTILAKIGLGAY